MGHDSQSDESRGGQGSISHYQLDFQRNGNRHYYIWQHNPVENAGRSVLGMLIDLNNVFVPNHEIERMVFDFVAPISGVISLAFANCHTHNQQDIKRKLKAGDLKLYSRTAFFNDIQKAMQWLEAQCANC